MSNVLFSSLKDEGPFILEWVAYHRVIGFDRIVIVTNDCTDGSQEILESLHRNGIITYLPNKLNGDEAAQMQAERFARENGSFSSGDHVMWLDMDEFLVPPEQNPSVPDMVADMQERGADALLLNWRVMGDSGRVGLPSGVIFDAFTGCSPDRSPINSEVKTLFRYGDDIERLHLHQPLWNPRVHQTINLIDGRGESLDVSYATRRSKLGTPRSGVTPRRGMSALGRINHYAVRTYELFALKRSRGLGFFGGANGEHLDRYDTDFYERHNCNTRVSTHILAYRDALLTEYLSLLSHSDISAAHARAVAFTLQRMPVAAISA